MPQEWQRWLQKLRITKRQARSLVKWAVYAALLGVLLVIQGVILSRLPIFGVKLNLIPCYILCVCVVEGADRGGVFALLAGTVWALCGADLGPVSIIVLTIWGLLTGILMERLFRNNIFTCLLCCFGGCLVNETVTFFLLLFLGRVTAFQYVRIALPAVAMSMVGCPIFYYLSRLITRIGGSN